MFQVIFQIGLCHKLSNKTVASLNYLAAWVSVGRKLGLDNWEFILDLPFNQLCVLQQVIEHLYFLVSSRIQCNNELIEIFFRTTKMINMKLT